jgi:hypothetical protein
MKNILVVLIFLSSTVIVNAQKGDSNLEQTIKIAKAKKIKTLVHISGGKLDIYGGSSDLADVKLSYDKHEWNPTVSYTEDDNLGKLVVKASTEGLEKHIDDDNICRIALNDKFEYSLGIVLGAGEANLDFEGFNIAKALFKLGVGSFNISLANTSLPFLKIEAGIGKATLDLSGEYKNDLRAEVNAGIGELKVYVPENMSVKFEINGFLGDVDAKGFKKKGDEYTNKNYGKTKHSITMRIKGAIGSIKIISK